MACYTRAPVAFGGKFFLWAHRGLRCLAERIVLSAGPARKHAQSGEIFRKPYCESLVKAVRAASLGKEEVVKLSTLCDVVSGLNGYVLVFTVHRCVAQGVYEALTQELDSNGMPPQMKEVRLHLDDEAEAVGWFTGQEPWQGREPRRRVLVATDVLSESGDLHQRADYLIHYELPWSPLRVLQRVGRLWRPREFPPIKVPPLPAICHIAHPGGAEEEILARLRRRWRYLKVLGLDHLTMKQALGPRLPSVGW